MTNDDIAQEIETRVKAALGMRGTTSAAEEDDAGVDD